MRAIVSAATRTGSTTIRPTAKWKRSHSAIPVSCHEPSRRRSGYGSSAAGGGEIYAAISVRAGRVRIDVSDQRDRHVDPSDPQIRQRRAPGLSVAENAVGRHRHDVERHAVHDGARRRLRRRRDRNCRALRGRRVAALWRQVVLLACRCGYSPSAGTPEGAPGGTAALLCLRCPAG